MLPVAHYQPAPFASGLPYSAPHTDNINYVVKLPDGTTATTAQTDIEADTSWHHTRAKQLSTPELTAAELMGRRSVDVRSALNGWVPAFVVPTDGQPS